MQPCTTSQTHTRYKNQVAEVLREKTVASDATALEYLAACAALQQFKQVSLAYILTLRQQQERTSGLSKTALVATRHQWPSEEQERAGAACPIDAASHALRLGSPPPPVSRLRHHHTSPSPPPSDALPQGTAPPALATLVDGTWASVSVGGSLDGGRGEGAPGRGRAQGSGSSAAGVRVPRGMLAGELAAAAEDLVLQRHGMQVVFDAEEALGEVARLGLGTVTSVLVMTGADRSRRRRSRAAVDPSQGAGGVGGRGGDVAAPGPRLRVCAEGEGVEGEEDLPCVVLSVDGESDLGVATSSAFATQQGDGTAPMAQVYGATSSSTSPGSGASGAAGLTSSMAASQFSMDTSTASMNASLSSMDTSQSSMSASMDSADEVDGSKGSSSQQRPHEVQSYVEVAELPDAVRVVQQHWDGLLWQRVDAIIREFD